MTTEDNQAMAINQEAVQPTDRRANLKAHLNQVVDSEINDARQEALKICIRVIMKDHRVSPDNKFAIADRMSREVNAE